MTFISSQPGGGDYCQTGTRGPGKHAPKVSVLSVELFILVWLHRHCDLPACCLLSVLHFVLRTYHHNLDQDPGDQGIEPSSLDPVSGQVLSFISPHPGALGCQLADYHLR